MPGSRGTYKRVLLKLSGEVFGGNKGIGVDPDVLADVAKQIADVVRAGTQVAIVVGGGNFFRGAELSERGMERSRADYMGMLGTVKEVSLLEQAFAKDAKKTVQQILDEAGTAVKAFHRFRVGQ